VDAEIDLQSEVIVTEFNTRIAAQRRMLEIINSRKWNEELFSLASKAIERWLVNNRIDNSSELATLVRAGGAKLFFLANKSQEQITEDYRLLSKEVRDLTLSLEATIKGYP
jgi:hypothetical protein